MVQNNHKSPVIAVAKSIQPDTAVMLSSGVRAYIRGVSATLIDSVTSRVEMPTVPKFPNPDKDNRLEENPFDPEYKRALSEANKKRGLAAMDAMVMFGFKLVDPIPPDSEWLDQLRFLERIGHLDLSEYDLSDPMTKEFVYKRYVAVSNQDIELLSGPITQEEIAKAEESFPGN